MAMKLGKSEITPFWRRMPRFFLYPFHLTPLVAITLAALLTLFIGIVPFGTFLVPLAIAIGFFRYAYRVLDRTAHGILSPEQASEQFHSDGAYRIYKQLGVFIVFGAVSGAVTAALGDLVGKGTELILSLALPATVMVLAVTNSLRRAVNPIVLWQLMRTIGWPYLLLNFCTTALWVAASYIAVAASAVVPTAMVPPLVAWVLMFFMLVMFNMMGYVLYQYHDRLGLEQKGAPGANAAETGIDRIAELVEENRISDAIDLAYEAQRRDPEDLNARERYHRLLDLGGKQAQLVSHAQSYIKLLLRKNKAARAIELFEGTRKKEPSFRLDSAADQLEVAGVATRLGHHKFAMQALLQFDRHYANSREIPAAWLLQGKILADRLKQDRPALQLLRLLVSKYPDAPQAAEARQQLAVLERLQAAKAV